VGFIPTFLLYDELLLEVLIREMKSDFLIAITQLSAEKNLPKEVVLDAVEKALTSAYKKESFVANQNIRVKINPSNGSVKVWAEKTVVETPTDTRHEISLDDALKIKTDSQLDGIIEVEATPHNAGRVAAQTAKQVIIQKLHEAEHSAIFEEFATKEGEILVGVVQRIDPKQVYIDLGRTEAVMPAPEQVSNERYRVGQRLRVYLLDVGQASKGPRVLVSRSHPDLLRRLFELEVPEVYNGAVEIKGIAREAGYRSKIAVSTTREGIDPVGCCVGLRGIRIQNIVSELNGEKIDVVMWDPNHSVYIANALSPTQVLGVELDAGEQIATVIVPDKQLSLAIGKEGQNVRLAAKLTGCRIDIKSLSVAEVEKAAKMEILSKAEEIAIKSEEPAIIEDVIEDTELLYAKEAPVIDEEVPVEVGADIDNAGEPVHDERVEEKITLSASIVKPLSADIEIPVERPKVRFAEDILGPNLGRVEAKQKKKKKKGPPGKETGEDGIRLKKRQKGVEIPSDDEEF